MTNNPLPAALASIKRETIDKACIAYNDQSMQFNDAQYVCMRAAIEAVLSDILPPPADGSVTDEPTPEMIEAGKDERMECFKTEGRETNPMSVGVALSRIYKAMRSAAPPADSAMVEVLFDSLDEILNYTGGADNALEDEYVVERARALLAVRK